MKLFITISIVSLLFVSNSFSQLRLNQIDYNYSKMSLSKIDNNKYYSDQSIVLQRTNHSAINISVQFLVGSAFAPLFTVLPLAAWASYYYNHRDAIISNGLALITLSAYLLGATVGVHLVAIHQNPKLSFWNTFAYSAIGSGFSALMYAILASYYSIIPSAGGVIAALCPILGAMFYASFVADWPKSDTTSSRNISSFNDVSTTSFKDYYNSAKTFDVELIRVSF